MPGKIVTECRGQGHGGTEAEGKETQTGAKDWRN